MGAWNAPVGHVRVFAANPAMREICSECGLLGGPGEPGGATRTRNTKRGLLAGVRASETAPRREEGTEGGETGRKL